MYFFSKNYKKIFSNNQQSINIVARHISTQVFNFSPLGTTYFVVNGSSSINDTPLSISTTFIHMVYDVPYFR